jgi:hypothetical protein
VQTSPNGLLWSRKQLRRVESRIFLFPTTAVAVDVEMMSDVYSATCSSCAFHDEHGPRIVVVNYPKGIWQLFRAQNATQGLRSVQVSTEMGGAVSVTTSGQRNDAILRFNKYGSSVLTCILSYGKDRQRKLTSELVNYRYRWCVPKPIAFYVWSRQCILVNMLSKITDIIAPDYFTHLICATNGPWHPHSTVKTPIAAPVGVADTILIQNRRLSFTM